MPYQLTEADKAIIKAEQEQQVHYIVKDKYTTTTTTRMDEKGVPRARHINEQLDGGMVLLSYLFIFCYWILLCFFYIFVYTHLQPWLHNSNAYNTNPYVAFLVMLLMLAGYVVVIISYVAPPFFIYALVDAWDEDRLRIRD